jgi:hypothetical protein
VVTTCYILSNAKYFVGCGGLFVLVVCMETRGDNPAVHRGGWGLFCATVDGGQHGPTGDLAVHFVDMHRTRWCTAGATFPVTETYAHQPVRNGVGFVLLAGSVACTQAPSLDLKLRSTPEGYGICRGGSDGGCTARPG